MVVCNRCGKKITRNADNIKRVLTVYGSKNAYIDNHFDLCKECSEKLKDYLGKASSYFMTNNDNPEGIFDNVKYWDTLRW